MKTKAVIRLTCIGLLALLAPTDSWAQQADSIVNDARQLQEVTIQARRAPMKVTSTSPVQLLGKEEIKSLGLQNMADAVKRFAGVYKSSQPVKKKSLSAFSLEKQ